MALNFFDSDGVPIAYTKDEINIFFYDGRPVGIIDHRVDFPHFRGHTEKFDIISSLEVCYGRTKRS
jgi:hypothetical protein